MSTWYKRQQNQFIIKWHSHLKIWKQGEHKFQISVITLLIMNIKKSIQVNRWLQKPTTRVNA